MNWNLKKTQPEETEVEPVVTIAVKIYEAVKGITHDPLKLRVEPGELVPAEVLKDKKVLKWLLRKKAIREVK